MRVIAGEAGASQQSGGLEGGAVGIHIGGEAGKASGARGGLPDSAADDQVGLAEADGVADGHAELIEEGRFEKQDGCSLLAQGGPSPGGLGGDFAVDRKLSSEQAQLHQPCFARRESHHGGEIRFVVSSAAFGREGRAGIFVERETGGDLQVAPEQFARLQRNTALEAGAERVDGNEGGEADDDGAGEDGQPPSLVPRITPGHAPDPRMDEEARQAVGERRGHASVKIRPPRIVMTRPARRANSGSWVTRTSAVPAVALRSKSISTMGPLVSSSRLPVGS